MPPYLLTATLMYLLLGALWHVIDRAIGVSVYRWYYAMTHETPLAADEKKGFICQRRARARFAAAVALALFHSVLLMRYAAFPAIDTLVSFFIQVPILMMGFYLGPLVQRIWKGKEEVFEAVDKLEQGEISVKDEISGVSEKAVTAVRELVGRLENPLGVEEKEPEGEGDAAESLPEEEEIDPRQMMDEYLRRGPSRNE